MGDDTTAVANGLVNNNSALFTSRRGKSRHDIITDEQREMQLLPDPFTNNMVLGPFDWLVLALGTLIILPFRVIGVVLSMGSAWFVAKIGLFGLTGDNFYICRLPKGPFM